MRCKRIFTNHTHILTWIRVHSWVFVTIICKTTNVCGCKSCPTATLCMLLGLREFQKKRGGSFNLRGHIPFLLQCSYAHIHAFSYMYRLVTKYFIQIFFFQLFLFWDFLDFQRKSRNRNFCMCFKAPITRYPIKRFWLSRNSGDYCIQSDRVTAIERYSCRRRVMCHKCERERRFDKAYFRCVRIE